MDRFSKIMEDDFGRRIGSVWHGEHVPEES